MVNRAHYICFTAILFNAFLIIRCCNFVFMRTYILKKLKVIFKARIMPSMKCLNNKSGFFINSIYNALSVLCFITGVEE